LPAKSADSSPPVPARTPGVAPPAASVEPPAATLTRRERQGLDAVAPGLSNDEIAAELYLSPNTVKGHLKRLFRKIGVSSRWEARDLAPRLLGEPSRGRE